MVYGRELRFPNELMYTDIEDSDTASVCPVDFITEKQELFKKSFAAAWHRVGSSPKWQRFYSGPFLVLEKLGAVNLRI